MKKTGNPHYGKWVADNDPAESRENKKTVCAAINERPLTADQMKMIKDLEKEKARLRNLQKNVSKPSIYEAYMSFTKGDIEPLVMMPRREIEAAIRELNFKINVIKGKAKV